MLKRTNKKGFTLVELLVVIAIIAIIAAVAVPVTISQIDKAKISTAKNEAAGAISAVQDAAGMLGTDGKDMTTANLAAKLTEIFKQPKQVQYIVLEGIEAKGVGDATVAGTRIISITNTTLKADPTEADGYVDYSLVDKADKASPKYLSIAQDAALNLGITTGLANVVILQYNATNSAWEILTEKTTPKKSTVIPAVGIWE